MGEAQDGRQTQQLTVQLCPRVLLLDWQMPGPYSPDIVRFVRTHCPGTKVLVMTGYDRDAYLAEMIDAGAAGYLIKPEMIPSRLIEAIRRAARGEVLFDGQQLERARRWRETVDAKWHSLTDRERQVLMLIVRGKTDREIADDLSHCQRITCAFCCKLIVEAEAKKRKQPQAVSAERTEETSSSSM